MVPSVVAACGVEWGTPRRRGAASSLIAVLVVALLATQPAKGAEMNLVKNGDFSRVSEDKPVGWVASGDPTYVTQQLVTAYEGDNPCAKLTCTRCEGQGGSRHAMIAQMGQVHLQKGRQYELSCRIRVEGMQRRTVGVALTDTANWDPCGLRRNLRVGESWRHYRVPFEALRSVGESGRLQFWFTEPGTLYLDDVRIVGFEPTDIVFTHVVPEGAGRNLLPNGSFELGMIGWSAVGRGIAWGNLDRLHGRIESSGAPHGSCFLRVPLGGEEGPVLYWDYYEPAVRPLRMMLAANLGWIRVEPEQPYTLSCDLRASVEGATVILGVRAQDPGGSGMLRGEDLRHKVQPTTRWQRYSFTFRPKSRYVYVTVGPDLDEEMRVDVDVDAIQLEKGEQATRFGPHSQVEMGIEPSEPGGIFTEGRPASLRLRAYNCGTSPAVVRATFKVTDFFDASVRLPPVSLDVPAGGLAERNVPLPAHWKGYYRLHATYDGEGVSGAQSLRLAVVPPRSETDSILGINHAFPDRFLIDQAKKAGVAWYRDWSLKWHDLEPSPGEYHWDVGDAQLDRVVAEGVHLMALMPPYPSAKWNTTGSPEAAVSDRLPRELAWAPSDPRTLGDFVQKAVAHYRDRVQIWEFLNEPIYTHYALPARGGDYEPADYVRLLAVAYAAMHRADPDCKVIGGIGSLPRKLTKEVIEAGCLDYVDIFVLHMYPGHLTPEHFIPQTDTMLQHMEEHGGRKPMWVTEFSYYGDDDPPSRPYVAGQSWTEDRLLTDERECAEYTIRLFALMMARGVEKFFVHAGVGGRVNAPYYGCCFFKYGGAPARLFPALAVYTELMGPKPQFAAEKRLGEDGYCLGFETGKRSVLVLWRANGKATVAVPEDVECLDIMGCAVQGRAIAISPTPVYLVGPAGRARELTASVTPATHAPTAARKSRRPD